LTSLDGARYLLCSKQHAEIANKRCLEVMEGEKEKYVPEYVAIVKILIIVLILHA